MRKALIITVSVLVSLSVLAVGAYHMVLNGVILLNNPSVKDFPVRGVDVSHYQGEIDWDILATEDISFAFIKATEGSSFVDDEFQSDFENAQKTNLRVGAYHFFSFDSEGKTQAENFISTVEKTEDMLPPVIDFEFYGKHWGNTVSPEDAREQLNVMISMLEEYYGMRPIIYSTEEAYDIYLAGEYDDYDLWIRNVISKPKTSDNRKWTFWQYTNRKVLNGYSGEEKFIDMNVFNGSFDEFVTYGK